MSEIENTPVAQTSPAFEELFCVVCAVLTETGETKPFCSKSCEDYWTAYDTGRITWAMFAELSF